MTNFLTLGILNLEYLKLTLKKVITQHHILHNFKII